jgi:hypothetical protein
VPLDWPAFGNALWAVSDQLEIRPEWQLPVLAMETGGTFDPATVNPYGCVGLNQFCPRTYGAYVQTPVDDYRTWTASAQLAGPVLAYWSKALHYGPIRSSTRLMLAQLGQGLLARAPTLGSVVFAQPSVEYRANAEFDVDQKGSITVQDLARAMGRWARSALVLDALVRAYALRPAEQPRDPVYGDDYEAPSTPIVQPPDRSTGVFAATVVALAIAMAGGYAAYGTRRRAYG